MNPEAISQVTNPPTEIQGQMAMLSGEIDYLGSVLGELGVKLTPVLNNGSLPPEGQEVVKAASPVPYPLSPLGKAIEHLASGVADRRRTLQLLTNNLAI